MTLQQRKEPFVQFGLFLKDFLSKNTELEYNTRENEFAQILQKARHYNGWFDDANLTLALKGLIKLTDSNDLNSFCNQIKEPKNPKTVAVIMAGNIPAVGFHDFLCVLLSGHNILIKTSSDDAVLMPWIINFISDTEPAFKSRIKFSEGKLEKFDALIATGSNNSAQYFEQYFNKIPRIIRKNRNSVALLNGLENMEDLQILERIYSPIMDWAVEMYPNSWFLNNMILSPFLRPFSLLAELLIIKSTAIIMITTGL